MFDRSLLHEYNEWKTLQPGFAYHGHNTYTYLLDKFGSYSPAGITANDITNTPVNTVVNSAELLPTFDFVTIQLYEGYSHAEYNTSILKQSPSTYLTEFIDKVSAGWNVDFSTDVELNYDKISKVSVDRTRLVIGLANGWAGDGKFLLIYPEQVGT